MREGFNFDLSQKSRITFICHIVSQKIFFHYLKPQRIPHFWVAPSKLLPCHSIMAQHCTKKIQVIRHFALALFEKKAYLGWLCPCWAPFFA